MKIILTQDEIHQAVEAHVRSQINIAANQEVTIDFTAGRGENGLTATLDIRTSTAPAAILAGVIPRNDAQVTATSVTMSAGSASAAAANSAKVAQNVAQAAATDASTATTSAADAVTSVEDAVATEEAEAPRKNSLFNKMKAEAAPAEAVPVAEARPTRSIFSKAPAPADAE